MSTSSISTQSSTQQIAATSSSATLLQTISALTFGAIILYAVGFLPMDVAHNAAHDTRHTLAFPCH